MKRIRVVAIVENTASGRGIRGEHGLSFWIEVGPHRLLFDTGQTPDVMLHNADLLKIDLATIDAIVLSHGHYDHTGGLAAVLRRANRPRLMLHPAALQQRFSRQRDGGVHEVGIPPTTTQATLQQGAELIWTETPTEIVPGIAVTGGIPRVTEYEDTGGDFWLDQSCTQSDPIADDQAVYFDTLQGTVVLLGCAHAGVINTLHYVQKLTGGRPIHAVIGGMHLAAASASRLDRTVDALRPLNVRLIAPTHCTGAASAARLWSEFPQQWEPCPVGTCLDFERR